MERACLDRLGQKCTELQSEPRDGARMHAPALWIPLEGSRSVPGRLYRDAVPFCGQVLSFHVLHS